MGQENFIPERLEESGKILLIDDDEKFLRTTERLLLRHNYNVVATTNPFEGIDLSYEDTYGVVLTDTVMPGMNGYQVLKKIQEQGRVTQVVIMTGFAEPIKVLDAYILGASDYLVKPPSIEDLLQTIERAMYRYYRWRRMVVSSGFGSRNIDVPSDGSAG